MNTRTPRPSASLAEHARQIRLAESYEQLLHTIWQCECFERDHPFTVATIRSLAPRPILADRLG